MLAGPHPRSLRPSAVLRATLSLSKGRAATSRRAQAAGAADPLPGL